MNRKTAIEHVPIEDEVMWNRKRYQVQRPTFYRPITTVKLRNVATGRIKSLPFGTLVTVVKAKVTR